METDKHKNFCKSFIITGLTNVCVKTGNKKNKMMIRYNYLPAWHLLSFLKIHGVIFFFFSRKGIWDAGNKLRLPW